MYNTQRVPLFVLIRASHSHFISDRTARLHCQRSMNQKQFMRGEMFIMQMETTGRVGWGGKCKALCRKNRQGCSKQLTWANQWNQLNLNNFICKMGMGQSCYKKIYDSITIYWASLVAQLAKNLPVMWKTWVRFLGWEDPLEKGKATHSITIYLHTLSL